MLNNWSKVEQFQQVFVGNETKWLLSFSFFFFFFFFFVFVLAKKKAGAGGEKARCDVNQ